MTPDPMKSKDVTNDGSCMFRAILHAVTDSDVVKDEIMIEYKNKDLSTESKFLLDNLRKLATDWIYKEWDNLCLEYHGNTFIDTKYQQEYNCSKRNVYCQFMQNFATWGTNLELLALAKQLKKCITVYNDSSKTWIDFQPYNDEKCNEYIFIKYVPHYYLY